MTSITQNGLKSYFNVDASANPFKQFILVFSNIPSGTVIDLLNVLKYETALSRKLATASAATFFSEKLTTYQFESFKIDSLTPHIFNTIGLLDTGFDGDQNTGIQKQITVASNLATTGSANYRSGFKVFDAATNSLVESITSGAIVNQLTVPNGTYISGARCLVAAFKCGATEVNMSELNITLGKLIFDFDEQ